MHEVRGYVGLGRLYDIETTHPGGPGPLQAKQAARLLYLPAPGWRG